MKQKIGNIFVLISICAIVVFAETVPGRQQRSTDTCGTRKIKSGLIVKGQSFTRGNFPWIVALMYSKVTPPVFFCAGTLISKTYVVSAAHCINEKHSLETLLPRDVLAFFGAHNLNNYFESGRNSLSPKKISIHDDWNPRTTEYDGDLSLLEFEEGSIYFNTYVQPICLWDSENVPTETEGTVTGWGRSEDRTKKHETEPKLIKVLIQSQEKCFLETKALIDLSSERTFCAGLRNGSGVCHGDSGGGLFIRVHGMFYLRGIVSSSLLNGDDCDASKNAVYTNVLKFRDWIAKTTGGLPISSTKALTELICSFEVQGSNCCGELNTCVVNHSIGSEDHALGSGLDTSVGQFSIYNNKEVKFLPRHIGEKLPNLKSFAVESCGLTVVRNHYFKDMGNLKDLWLYDNKISAIESDSFRDLISVEKLNLHYNMIETLDEKLFTTMVNLKNLLLNNNKIRFLGPATFNIPQGKLQYVRLGSNVCIDRLYDWKIWNQLETDIRANCMR